MSSLYGTPQGMARKTPADGTAEDFVHPAGDFIQPANPANANSATQPTQATVQGDNQEWLEQSPDRRASKAGKSVSWQPSVGRRSRGSNNLQDVFMSGGAKPTPSKSKRHSSFGVRYPVLPPMSDDEDLDATGRQSGVPRTDWRSRRSFGVNHRVSVGEREALDSSLALSIRTVTIVDEDQEQERECLILASVSEADDGSEVEEIIAEISDPAEFVASIQERPNDWFEVVLKYLCFFRMSQGDMDAAEHTIALAQQASDAALKGERQAKTATAHLNLQVDSLQTDIQRAREIVERVRKERNHLRFQFEKVQDDSNQIVAHLKDKHKSKIKEMNREVKKLREELEYSRKTSHKEGSGRRKKDKPRKTSRRDLSSFQHSDDDPSDDSSDSSSSSDSSVSDEGFSGRRKQREGTPRSVGSTAAGTTLSEKDRRSNNKWKDIDKFSGKENEDLDMWIESALTKFRQSYELFPDEWSKIEYLRAACTDRALVCIRNRAVESAANHYVLADELFQDLQTSFGLIDKQSAALAELHSGKLQQRDNEPFGEWLARFEDKAARAGLVDRSKMFQAVTNLNPRMKACATNAGFSEESWPQFVRRMQQSEVLKNLAYGKKSGNKEDNKKSENTKSSSSSSRKPTDNANRRPAKEFAIVKAKKVCVRCLKPGHLPGKDNQPDSCKNNPPATMPAEWLAMSVEEPTSSADAAPEQGKA